MSAITLDNVSKRYGDVHALRPLSVEFPAGKLSTIFGKSGSGKTTLLSVIAGLLKPTTGAIWYQDKDIAALTKDECAALRRTDIGVVFQDHNIINELTVLENVRLPLEANGMSRMCLLDMLNFKNCMAKLFPTIRFCKKILLNGFVEFVEVAISCSVVQKMYNCPLIVNIQSMRFVCDVKFPYARNAFITLT